MATHVAILLKPYLQLILQGRKTIETRLTRHPIAPYKSVAAGDTIYFKASSGPYMAQATVERVDFHDALTPGKIEALRKQHNDAICGEMAYWKWKRNSRYATLIWLRDVKPISDGPAIAPSRGIAWFVVQGSAATTRADAITAATTESPKKATVPVATKPEPDTRHHPGATPETRFQVSLTAGALRNSYVRVPTRVHRFPDDAYGGKQLKEAGKPVTLLLPDGRRVQTDVLSTGMIRWRGWDEYFKRYATKAAGTLTFEPQPERTYRVYFGAACPPGPDVHQYVTAAEVAALIRIARHEDLGPCAWT